MPFYENLGMVYDRVFPENPVITAFLSEGLPPESNILDIACGTGGYACALAAMGHTVTGIDLDSGMIERAKAKCRENTTFFTSDMLSFDTATGSRTFDRIYCVGNSLPHLHSREEIQSLCHKAKTAIRKNGSFLLQTVNFRRVLDGHMDALPVIENREAGIRFQRSYEPGEIPGTVTFNGTLSLDGDSWHDHVTLLALEQDELSDILQKAGFTSLEYFGDYKKNPFTAESPALIIRAC